jgi:L-malate glycosyltransferase
MKKILIITNEFPPDIGGAGVVARDIAQTLSHKNHDMHVITQKNKLRKEIFNFHFYEICKIPKVYPLFYIFKIFFIGINRFDTIILNDLAGTLTACFFFPKKLQQRSIVYMHGDEPEHLFIKRSFFNRLTNLKSRYAILLDNCKRIITVSKFLSEKLIRFTRMFHLNDKITIIHNGVDNQLFFPAAIDLHERYSIPRERDLLLSVSRVVEGKGYKNMYNVFKRLTMENLPYQWVIVGEGPYITTLTEFAKRDGLLDQITFISNTHRDNLRNYYSSVDVFWQLSNFEESLGLVYIEAAACGTPSIGRKAYGVLEAIEDGVSGFLVENDEECYELLKKRQYKTLDRKRVLNYSKRFDLNESIGKLLTLL